MATEGFQWRILEEPEFFDKTRTQYCLLRIWVNAAGEFANGMRPSCITSKTMEGLAGEVKAMDRAFLLPRVRVVNGRYEEVECSAPEAAKRPRRKIAS